MRSGSGFGSEDERHFHLLATRLDPPWAKRSITTAAAGRCPLGRAAASSPATKVFLMNWQSEGSAPSTADTLDRHLEQPRVA